MKNHIFAVGSPIASKYRVVKVLGVGAMGVVYKAQHEFIKTHVVAIKVLLPEAAKDPDIVRRFKNEADAMGAMKSPYIVRLLDFGYLKEQTPYLVMEFAEGVSLHDLIQTKGKLTEEETIKFSYHITQALIEAHKNGIIHRDLKPENVFCVQSAENGEMIARVLDFGIAKITEHAQIKTKQTQKGMVLCTPEYGAPEVFYGKPEQISDLYSLGIIMIEMLIGDPPYLGPTPTVIAAKHLSNDPVPIPETIHDDFRDIISYCVAKDPRKRFQSALALRNALQTVIQNALDVRPVSVTSNHSVITEFDTNINSRIVHLPKTEMEHFEEVDDDQIIEIVENVENVENVEKLEREKNSQKRPHISSALENFFERDSRLSFPKNSFKSSKKLRLPAQITPSRVHATWKTLQAHPASAAAYRSRFLFLKEHDHDAAFLVLGSLIALGGASENEQYLYKRYRNTLPKRITTRLDEADILSLEPPSDRYVRRIFAILGSCALDDIALIEKHTTKLQYDGLITSQKQWKMLPFFQQSASVIGVSPPNFYVGEDIKGVQILNTMPSAVAISEEVWKKPFSRSWLYVSGKTIGGLLAPYRLAAIAPNIQFIELWFKAIVYVATKSRKSIEKSDDIRARALVRLPKRTIEVIKETFLKLVHVSETVDVAKWMAMVEETLDRLGLLLSGDITSVAKRMRELRPISFRTIEARMLNLILFNASPIHASLHQKIGMTINTNSLV